MRRLDGKVAVVTGAGSIAPGWGNGRATSVLFAREGARLVLVDRNEGAVKETQRLVVAEGGVCTSVVADVSTADGVEAYTRAAVDAFGGIDVWQHNVGIGSPGPTVGFPESRWDLIYRVNVTSLFLGCQKIIPLMKERGGGAIVTVSSIASLGWAGAPWAAYSSSKAALNQLTEAIALEHAPDAIRCNVVVVGMMDTPTVGAVFQERTADANAARELNNERAARVPLGRTGSPWDVARASLFLASDESEYITGSSLRVDGGVSRAFAQ